MRKGQKHSKESILKMIETRKRNKLEKELWGSLDDGPTIDSDRKISIWKRMLKR